MKTQCWGVCCRVAVLFGVCVWLAGAASGAVVGGGGYTNAFTSQPSAADWATFNRSGGAGDAYDITADVNATITAAAVSGQVGTSSGNPPDKSGTAVWSSSGQYLQVRPTGNRFTALMGKFVNSSGTNASEVRIAYQHTVAAGGTPEDSQGFRGYFSLTGQLNSWTNLPGFTSLSSVNGSVTLVANIPVAWTNGGTFYFLAVDDNSNAGGDDVANQMDNFSLRITAGLPTYYSCAVTIPAQNSVFVSGTVLTAMAVAANGTSPYRVEYFTNSGAGNVTFASAGFSTTPPYSVSLGALPAGAYNVYAVTTDSSVPAVEAVSSTNVFSIADPINFRLAFPTNGSILQYTNTVFATAQVSGGTSPYRVQFFLDGVSNGPPVFFPPYWRTLGTLPVGQHVVSATVTDAKGWSSNAVVSTIYIDGPLAAILSPPTGFTLAYNAPLSLSAMIAGGTPPYSGTFYVNGWPAGTRTAAPYQINTGQHTSGSYTCYVRAVDSSVPQQQHFSTTNVITILPKPLKIIPLGDSITLGLFVPGGYRAPLYQVLTNAGYSIDFSGTQSGNGVATLPDPEHEGYSGFTIRGVNNILPDIFGATPDPDIILIFLGTNDYRGSGDDVNNATNRLEMLIRRMSTNWPGAKMIVGNLLPREPVWEAEIQKTFNPMLPALCERLRTQGVPAYFTDLRGVTTLADLPDGLHPTQFSYNKLATNWFAAIKGLTCSNCPPYFTLQPTNQNLTPGTNYTLVAATVNSGGSATYQWRFEGTNLPSATNGTLYLQNVSATNHGRYTVVATDANGSTASSNAQINVLIPPTFVLNPTPQTVLQGSTVTFKALATGPGPIWYRWFWSSVAWATNDTGVFVLSNVQSSVNIRVFATNWASGPLGVSMTPANGVLLRVLADADRDGMADAWEVQYGFNTNNAADALLDLDNDGAVNRHEYVAGTDPSDPSNVLKLTVPAEGAGFFEFVAQTNVGYSILYRTNLTSSPWTPLTNVAAQTQMRTIRVERPLIFENPERYYRIVTPPAP